MNNTQPYSYPHSLHRNPPAPKKRSSSPRATKNDGRAPSLVEEDIWTCYNLAAGKFTLALFIKGKGHLPYTVYPRNGGVESWLLAIWQQTTKPSTIRCHDALLNSLMFLTAKFPTLGLIPKNVPQIQLQIANQPKKSSQKPSSPTASTFFIYPKKTIHTWSIPHKKHTKTRKKIHLHLRSPAWCQHRSSIQPATRPSHRGRSIPCSFEVAKFQGEEGRLGISLKVILKIVDILLIYI